MRDEAKLDSFIKTVVTPLATALKDQPGLGGYDLLNEPEWAYTFKNVSGSQCMDAAVSRS